MVKEAKRLTSRMRGNHVLKDKTYTFEATLETGGPRKKPAEALIDAGKDEMIHRVYRAALKKMKAHADREDIALLIHPRITYLLTDTKERQDGFRGVLTLRLEAEAYTRN
jgi:hypothetical protein